jgi:hypothetical protein
VDTGAVMETAPLHVMFTAPPLVVMAPVPLLVKAVLKIVTTPLVARVSVALGCVTMGPETVAAPGVNVLESGVVLCVPI